MKQPTADHLGARSGKGGRPTREAAARLGEHILETALAEYSRHGMDSVSLDQIASVAGVSKRTLYARFNDRDGLLLAAIERGIERIVVPLAETPPAGTLHDQLRQIGTDMIRISLRPQTIGLERLIASIAQRNPVLHDRVADTVQTARLSLIRSILQQACERGEIQPSQIELAAPIIFDILVTNARREAIKRGIDGGDIGAIHRYLDAAVDLILYGITNHSPDVSAARVTPPA